MKFTYKDIRSDIIKIIERRECIAIRSKMIEKSRFRDDNYEGYYLFAIPP